MTKVPSYAALPPARPRATRGGPEARPFSVRLKTVTPILGGSYRPRQVDDIDVIRVPSVRGHLRFWWRALYASSFASAEELHRRESALWGAAAGFDGGRSAVEIRIGDGLRRSEQDSTDIKPEQTVGAYALWPARAEKRQGQIVTPAAPRWRAGVEFDLHLKVFGTPQDELEVRNAVRAWVLFGGYGSRTRRGVGSVTVVRGVEDWLPHCATREAFEKSFGFDIFARPARAPGDTPWLAGASLLVAPPATPAESAWKTAVGWLREFRQGTELRRSGRAREPGPNGDHRRPSISNWPEADKLRHLAKKTIAHPPRHNATPAWPRAGFGLPIVGRFQTKARNGGFYDEPPEFELCWNGPDGNGKRCDYDRLASPLILKALPLSTGQFLPCALWLNRAYPAGGEVIVRGRAASRAPFDRLVAPGDRPFFGALENKPTLRRAFLDWLGTVSETVVVAP